jgi:hypothetical protein
VKESELNPRDGFRHVQVLSELDLQVMGQGNYCPCASACCGSFATHVETDQPLNVGSQYTSDGLSGTRRDSAVRAFLDKRYINVLGCSVLPRSFKCKYSS